MYFPLHCHSHYSLLDGLSSPSQLASRIKHLGLSGCALTDHGNISGSVAFTKEMKKNNLKPILLASFHITIFYFEISVNCTPTNSHKRDLK